MFILPLGPEEEDLLETHCERPYVTYALLVFLSVVFLLGTAQCTDKELILHTLNWGFIAERNFGIGLLTHQFIHGDFWHLLGNGLFLLAFGAAVELKLGHAALLVVYLVSGITGAWAFGITASPVSLNLGSKFISFIPPLIGASGAISGLIGCLLPLVPNLRIRLLIGFRFHWSVYPVKAWIVCILYFLKEVLWHLLLAGKSNTAYMAHVGGIIGGVFVGVLIIPQLGKVGLLLSNAVAKPARAKAKFASKAPRRVQKPRPQSSPSREAPSATATGTAPKTPSAAARVPAQEAPSAAKVESPTEMPSATGAALSRERPSESTSKAQRSDEHPRERELNESRVYNTHIGEVEEKQDLCKVSSTWASTWQQAELQRKLNKARKMEKKTEHAQKALDFYNSVLNDKSIPGGHRAYAGWRICLMLHRSGRPKMCLALAKKLLSNKLPSELENTIKQTAKLALSELKKKA